MIQRNISPKQIYDAYTKSTKYSDPDYPNATVYHYKGIAVAREGNILTTVYNQAKPKSRWKKSKGGVLKWLRELSLTKK